MRIVQSTKVTGLSKSIVKHSGRHSKRRVNVLQSGKQGERQALNESKRRAIIQGK
jgi:hypothetical protein